MEEAPVEESPVEEAAAEGAPVDNAANEEPMQKKPAPIEAAAEETVEMDVEEDGPLKEWTGKKAKLMVHIREAQAKAAEPVEESAVE